MSVFNPKILDASIRDITTDLADEQKVDVLIYAMQHLKLDRSVPRSRSRPRAPAHPSPPLQFQDRHRKRSRVLPQAPKALSRNIKQGPSPARKGSPRRQPPRWRASRSGPLLACRPWSVPD
ncbi:uncharacterized protein PHACADRAFT_260503 [Phanerochaete carnosa HHB-10118-sp]|uniref:Uncharacterized protein n=1 Tax=Phanerochaete carnosa (strain HHB-10118-sp) TaxID=650164 RepID=K5WPJ0_PHACS|nr:uncharacterized protein PHACADRAFT_260503 [Phanerochaete carnosa HHB-10118-sp]EKM52262.1 hypothetical protein PHACADRAFT_260503 [Phanerochaete carnosa HHB-10118-sp]